MSTWERQGIGQVTILTSNKHHADAEHFLGVGVRRHVAEADRREAAEREVKRCDVFRLDRRTTHGAVDIGLVRLPGQLVQPADLRLLQHGSFDVADGVPDAGEPVGDESERGHEQQQDGRSVLRVPIQLARHSDQAQETSRLQQSNQRRRLNINRR